MEHTRLVVPLPSYNSTGWVTTNDVIVTQNGGAGSQEDAFFTYVRACPAGQFEVNGICNACPPGAYNNPPINPRTEDNCIVCPRGWYQPSSSSVSCLQCAPGRFQNSSGASTCYDCNPGTISTAFSMPQCAQCPLGRYAIGGTSCAICQPGQYQPAVGQTACTSCDAGTYSSSPEQILCINCTAGTINGPGSSSCFDCPAGTYTLLPGSSQCIACEPGRYAQELGWSVNCLDCDPGRAQSSSGSTTCVDCVRGNEQPNAGQPSCSACQPGTYSATDGQAACTDCRVGRYANSTQATGCQDCDTGFYQASGGAPLCSACEPGSWNANYGSSFCFPCKPGRFQNETAKTKCEVCASGSFAGNERAAVCTACVAGTYQQAQAQTVCLECAVGRFTPVSGQSQCTHCSPGFFSNLVRAVSCSACGPGFYQALTGQADCSACAPGRSNPSTNASTCTDCAPGKFRAVDPANLCFDCPLETESTPARMTCSPCAPGKFADKVGTPACQDCVLGYVWNPTLTPPCQPCPAGSFSDAQGLNCTQCPAGKFSEGPSRPCTDCAAGSFSASMSSTSCDFCAPGKSSQGGQISCTSCPPTQYAPKPNSSLCFVCPSNSIVDRQNVSCLCDPGLFSQVDQNGYYSCTKCTSAMVCDSRGVTLTGLQTAPGYWRVGSNLTFYLCPQQQFCNGGDLTANPCQPHREGVLCAFCEAGYKASVSGICDACPEHSNSIAYSVLLLCLMAFLVTLLFYIVLKFSESQQSEVVRELKERNDAIKKNINESLQRYDTTENLNSMEGGETGPSVAETADLQDSSTRSMEISMAAVDEGFRNAPEFDKRKIVRSQQASQAALNGVQISSDVFIEKPVKRKSVLDLTIDRLEVRRTPNYMYKVKILVGYFQIALIFPLHGGIQWPTIFVDFLNAFSFLNFDFMPWQSLSCVTTITYFEKAWIVGITPLIVLAGLLIFFYAPCWMRRRMSLEEQLTKDTYHNQLKQKLVKLVLFTVFLLYPFVSKTILAMFNCMEVEGTYYLLADFTLHCFDDLWNQYAVLCGIFVFIYPFGIPVFYFILLSKAPLRDPATRYMLGFLYDAYTKECYYWELVDMFHKLILTGLVAFAPSNAQLIINMCIVIAYLELLLWRQPYVRKGDDRFHLLVQIELYLLAFVGFVLTPPHSLPLTPEMQVLVALLLIGLTTFLASSFLVIAGRNVLKIVKEKRNKRKKATTATQGDAVDPGSDPHKTPDSAPAPPEHAESL